jgi:hypothetical protein
MNSRECTIIQKLIADLDDTRLLYTQLRPLLIRPHLKFLVARITESHVAIADELVGQMDRTGGLTARRGGGVLAGLRAKVESWIAIASLDIEVGCLKRVARPEGRVIQRFREALEHVKGLNQNLHRELCELERACLRIETLLREMERPSLAVARRPATSTRLSTHEGPRP